MNRKIIKVVVYYKDKTWDEIIIENDYNVGESLAKVLTILSFENLKKGIIKVAEYFSDKTFEEIDIKSDNDAEIVAQIQSDVISGTIVESESMKKPINYDLILDEIFKHRMASVKMKVNVAIYVLSKRFLYREDEKNFISTAADIIAKYQGVEKATVLDKMYRQMQTGSNDYRKKLINALKEDIHSDEYKNMLLSGAKGKKSENADVAMIKEYIE